MLKKDFISSNTIQETTQKQEQLSTQNTQDVNNTVEKEQTPAVNNTKNTTKTKETKSAKQVQNIEANKEETNSKKQTKSRTKKAEEKSKEQQDKKQPSAENYDNYYVFKSLSSEMIKTKSGEKEYTVGKFYDMQDKQHNIIVKPEYSAELQNCELGTLVQFTQIKEIEGRKFALDLNFIQKMEKNIAA